MISSSTPRGSLITSRGLLIETGKALAFGILASIPIYLLHLTARGLTPVQTATVTYSDGTTAIFGNLVSCDESPSGSLKIVWVNDGGVTVTTVIASGVWRQVSIA